MAIPLLLLIFLYLLITQKQLRLTIMAICIGIVLTICVTISIFPSQTIDKFNAAVTNATQFVDNEDGNKKQPSGTASERFILWKVAINTARKHPFFGSGPLGADRTIQVSVSPNTMLDKIIQMPTKPAHDFSGLFFIVWKKNLRGNKNTLTIKAKNPMMPNNANHSKNILCVLL
jgi:hypothetical protein